MIKNSRQTSGEFPYLDTPAGIITPKGHLFRTTEELLQKHAGPLFEHYSLASMLERAVKWAESTDGVGILVMLPLLMLFPVLPAVAISLAVVFLWHVYKSAVAGPALNGVVRLVSYDIFQLLIAVMPLSWLGMQGYYGSLAAGLVLFVAFRFGWIRGLADRLIKPKEDENKPGPDDRLLHMLLTRYALKEGIALPHLEKMESDIRGAMEKSKRQRQKWTRKHP